MAWLLTGHHHGHAGPQSPSGDLDPFVGEETGLDGDQPVAPLDRVVDDPAASGSLDQAPVKVGVISESRKGVLTVPINALLGLAEGGYGVRTADGRIVAVTPGLFSRGVVEVTGDGIAEGTEVEVPAS